jgi:uncharacterized protein YabN with tetrapyrrole methylase and pyrophosphatase domain
LVIHLQKVKIPAFLLSTQPVIAQILKFIMEYSKSIDRLRKIMDELRDQCPWDQKQTIHTLQPQTLEEVYHYQ